MPKAKLTYLQERYVYHLTADERTKGDRVLSAEAAQRDKYDQDAHRLKTKVSDGKISQEEYDATLASRLKTLKRLSPSDYVARADRYEENARVQEELNYRIAAHDHMQSTSAVDVIGTYEAIRRADIAEIYVAVVDLVSYEDAEGNIKWREQLDKKALLALPSDMRSAIKKIGYANGRVVIELFDKMQAAKVLAKYHGLDAGGGPATHEEGHAAQLMAAATPVLAPGKNPRTITAGSVPQEQQLAQSWMETVGKAAPVIDLTAQENEFVPEDDGEEELPERKTLNVETMEYE